MFVRSLKNKPLKYGEKAVRGKPLNATIMFINIALLKCKRHAPMV